MRNSVSKILTREEIVDLYELSDSEANKLMASLIKNNIYCAVLFFGKAEKDTENNCLVAKATVRLLTKRQYEEYFTNHGETIH